MKTRYLGVLLIASLFISRPAVADRQLDRAEVLDIFQRLTSQPRKTWIPAGTIDAIHEEYRAPKTTDPNVIAGLISSEIQRYQSDSGKRELTDDLQKMRLDAVPFNIRYRLSNECTMRSAVTVRFDGERFYWEIKVDSRTDTVEPGPDLTDNFMTDRFDLGWNGRRVFAWDGERYTTYSLPGNHAIVDFTGETPHVVTGPLTAGIIPWGGGRYSYEELVAADSSAVERLADSGCQVHLTVRSGDGSEMLLVLDPNRRSAVLSLAATGPGGSRVSSQYSDYRLVSGNWVPMTILVEQYDALTNKLLAYDLWKLTQIDGKVPWPGEFRVEYETDALIEYRSPLTENPQMGRYSSLTNTEGLFADRLAFAVSRQTIPLNCATAAVKCVMGRLGRSVSDGQLARLVTEPSGTTTLYAVKQFVQAQGLYCRAVQTNIETLKNLNSCQVILHVPGKNHFVVLAGFDNGRVWCIDLASDKFCYRTDVAFFGMDWTDGTALVVSGQPFQAGGELADIDENQLRNTVGGTGYTCTRLLQEYNVIFCSQPVPGDCEGYYDEYYRRLGCEAAPSGSCSTSPMVRRKESPCIVDPWMPWDCTVTGEWTYYYTRACE